VKKGVLFGLGVLSLLCAWQVLAFFIGKAWIIPYPGEALRAALKALWFERAWVSVGQTAWKVTLALLISTFVGIPIGYGLGRYPNLYRFFRPCLMVMQAVPVVSWLAFVFFTWGVGWRGPVFISSLSLLPISILTTFSGAQDHDIQLLEMATVYKVPQSKVFRIIWMGSLLPYILAVLEVSIGQAWKVMLVTEYLCSGEGLGEEIMLSRMNINTARAWGLTFIAVILGIASELLIKAITRKALPCAHMPES
jgi:NitT/TauT family transport system permease protein